MPVKLSSKLPTDDAEARIEIIPLIDIMFFLLATFMLVSLSMVDLKSVKVNLPTATASATGHDENLVDISIDKSGQSYLDQKLMAGRELARQLAAMKQANASIRVMISGDKDARHGDVIYVLDLIRNAGIDNVAFEIDDKVPESKP